jgi:TatD DNase family protein
VAHCFTGGPAELERYLELGLYVGITGWICDERRGTALRDAAARLPLDRVLLETDAPYLLPRTLKPAPRTRRNEPSYLPEILRVLAPCMGHEEGAIAQASSRNAERLFGLSPARP